MNHTDIIKLLEALRDTIDSCQSSLTADADPNELVGTMLMECTEYALWDTDVQKLLKDLTLGKDFDEFSLEQWKVALSVSPEDEKSIPLRFAYDLTDIYQHICKKGPVNLSKLPFFCPDNRFTMNNLYLVRMMNCSGCYRLIAHIARKLVDFDEENDWHSNEIFYYQYLAVECRLTEEFSKGERKSEEVKRKSDLLVEFLCDATNHMQIAYRMGLDNMGEKMYDYIDGMICREFNFRVVDIVKELRSWMKENWISDDDLPLPEQMEPIKSEAEKLFKKYCCIEEIPKYSWHRLETYLLGNEMVYEYCFETDDD